MNRVLLSDAKQRLLERMLQGQIARPVADAAVEPRSSNDTIPLTPSQRQIWLHSLMAPNVPIYNEPVAIRRNGPLDLEILGRSFQEILRRHEIWRTVFVESDGEVVQVVQEAESVSIPFTDVSSLPESERNAAAIGFANADARLPFEVSAGPLLRTRVVKLDENCYRFHIVFHHLISDGATIYNVLLPELAAIYEAFSAGQPSPLPAPRLQYADYALWHKRRPVQESMAGQLAYWRQALADAYHSDLQLPVDRPRPAMSTFHGGTETFAFPAGLTESVKRAAAEEGVTTHILLLAAFFTLLHRYNGQEDIIVGGVADGRRRAEFESLMGTFTNTLALRARPRAEMTFRELLAEVKELVLGAVANSDLPFDSVVRELHPRREAGRNPFYQVLFSVGPAPAKTQHSGWEAEQVAMETGASKCDLYFILDEESYGLIGRFHYSSDLFDRRTIERMAGHWLTLLASIIDDPSARLRDFAWITPQETHQLLEVWNDTAREIPDATLHEMFEHQAKATPTAVAVEAAGVRLTYSELNARANWLARRLQKSGVRPETLVGVCVDRTVDLIVAPLAVLKAGGAYLPLDSTFPKNRLAYLIEDAKAPILLASRNLASDLPSTDAQILYCDDFESADADADARNLAPVATPQSLAYLRYTSGSTGLPKGVEISHRALVNLLLSMQQEPGFTKADSLLAITTHSFDIADLELYLPLISGGRLSIASRDDAQDPRRLAQRLRDAKCSVMQATPTAWRALIDAGWSGQPNLKALCGGEALSRELADLLLPRVRQLWNVYGPTETTIWSSVQRVVPGAAPVSIGRPILNTQLYVLDSNRNLLPAGAAGELYIGGAGVARGYLRRRDLTDERFVPSPFLANAQMYRTGDLARRLPDGSIQCVGRVDNQLKIRGLRIEPGEIEAALGRREGIGSCVVIAREDAPGDKRLIAYFECHAQSAPSTGELRAYLKRDLPEYMIPGAFVQLEKLPLTPNGKIDRKSLPAPQEPLREMRNGFALPRDPLEHLLAQTWCKVLNLPRLGIHDNFFELGGHSLLAVRLVLEIEKLSHKKIPLATLLTAPTVAELADVLRGENWKPSWSSLVSLRPGGTRPPLFFMHSQRGNVLEYHPLASMLDPEWPVYALQARGLDGRIPRDITVEQMAAAHVKELRTLQPRGPYYLAGFCFGGLLALEAAQQLTAADQEVALLILIQTTHPEATRFKPEVGVKRFWFQAAKRMDLELENLSNQPNYATGRLRNVLNLLRVRASIAMDRKSGRRRDPAKLSMLYISEALGIEHKKAMLRYAPRPYRGPVLLFRTAKQLEGLQSDEFLGWKSILGDQADVCEVPGHQQNVLLEPHVSKLAQKLTERLQKHTRRRSFAAKAS